MPLFETRPFAALAAAGCPLVEEPIALAVASVAGDLEQLGDSHGDGALLLEPVRDRIGVVSEGLLGRVDRADVRLRSAVKEVVGHLHRVAVLLFGLLVEDGRQARVGLGGVVVADRDVLVRGGELASDSRVEDVDGARLISEILAPSPPVLPPGVQSTLAALRVARTKEPVR